MRSREKEMFTSPIPRGLMQRDCCVHVPLAGIPTIPEEADRWFKATDWDPPEALRKQTDAAIADAMAEHRRRREAVKAGMDLDEYFPPDRSSDDGTSYQRRDDEED